MRYDQFFLNRYVHTIVRDIRDLTPSIRMLELADPDDWDLPAFAPGAHVDLVLTPDLIRQYSLCGDPARRNRYFVAIQNEQNGRGGSRYIHNELRSGDTIPVSLPRNLFALNESAQHSVMIAGGIGLTPFMSMLPKMLVDHMSFHLHVCTRSRTSTPFLPFLDELAKREFVTFHHTNGDPASRINLAKAFADHVEGTHAYCCGPEHLLDAFISATAHWSHDSVHYERFGALNHADPAYKIELKQTGLTIEVLSGETMSNALKRHGVEVKTSCEAGICGLCKTRYLSGNPIHRDFCLTSDEQSICLTPCVSTSAGSGLVLDL